jgi:hypothetical protein
MPTLQEMANRAANRGVSYYTPTRAVRPSGTLANSGTARRVMQGGGAGRQQPNWFDRPAGGGQAQPQMQQMQLPSYRPPEQPGGGRTTLDDILDSIESRGPQPGQQPEQPGGWRGALGTVVNSWPAKAIMAPLNILDIPRRMTISTINEVADVFNGGDASFDDWFDQVKDANFGFGSVVGSTGNRWADRFIGFAGDILLDPMTYVAGAGVFAGTGRSARQRLAALAVSEGLGEDVIKSVGRYGLSGIDNATRARLRQAATTLGDDIGEQILDRGYYLKVPFMDGEGAFHRIPGTRRLDEAISPRFAEARAWMADTRLGTTLRNRVRSPEIMKEATEKLVTGRGTISFEDAAGIYLYTNTQRRLGNTASQRFLGEAKKLISESSRKELNDMIETAELNGGTELNRLFGRAVTFLQDAGINFYPRKNYVPHTLTQGAVEWFRSDSKLANLFRQALIPGLDLDDLSPRLMERHLLAGTVAEIGLEGQKRTFNAGAGTIRSINEEFAKVFPELKFKLFDDDVESIFKVYSQHIGDDIGRAGGLKALLNSKSRLVRLRSDDDMVKTLINEESLALLNKQTADMLRADHRALSDRIVKLRERQGDETQVLQGVVGVWMRDAIDELENLEPALKQELDQLIAEESARANAVGRVSTMTGDMPASNVGQLELKLQDAYQRLEQRAMAADARLADLQQQAARESIAWQTLQTLAGTDVGMMTVPEKFQALRQWNIAAAEAASLSMDRAAVSELRMQLAEQLRKATLAEAAAQNPAQVGIRAGLDLLPEELTAPGVRLGADGSILEYTGPTVGPRGARETAEKELHQRALVEYEGEKFQYKDALERYKNDMEDYKLRMKDWRKRNKLPQWKGKNTKPRKPVKPEPPKRQRRLTVATSRVEWDSNATANEVISRANSHRERAIMDLEALSLGPARERRAGLEGQLLSTEDEANLLERWGQARDAMQTDPNILAAGQARRELTEVESLLTRGRDQLSKLPRLAPQERREQAIRDAQERIDRAIGVGGVWKREGAGVVIRNDRQTAKALKLYERWRQLTRNGKRRSATSDALADEIADNLGYARGQRIIPKTKREAPLLPDLSAEQYRQRLAQQVPREESLAGARHRLSTAEDQLNWLTTRADPKTTKDHAKRVAALTERVAEMREEVARLTPPAQDLTPTVQQVDPRSSALANAQGLFDQRKSLERDIKMTTEGPARLPRLKRDPERVRIETEIRELEERKAALTRNAEQAEAASQPLRDEYKRLDTAITNQQRTYRDLQQPMPDDTRTVLLEMEQAVRSKQVELAEAERRVTRIAELHRNNIDAAERRVEAAVNMDNELRRIERDMWGEGEDEINAAARQAERHRQGELHAAKQEFAEAQKPVTNAKKRRDQIARELEDMKEELASGKWTPTEVGAQIRRINNTEGRLLRDAHARMPRVKTEWRIFPEIDAPPRRAAYTTEQRERLKDLYDIVHKTHPVDRSGAGGAYVVRQARETVERMVRQGGPKGPRDANALVEAQRVLGDHAMGRMNTTAHEAYRRAISEINAIERSVVESPTYAQQQFGDVRKIQGMIDNLEELRTPLPVPPERSQAYRALARAPEQRTVGGPRDVIGMAKENHELAEDWLANYADDLVDTGAIESTQVEFVAGLKDELAKWIDMYTRPRDARKTPDIQSEIRTASNDLGRMVDIMLSAQASIKLGYEPTPQLMTAVAAHRFMRERRRLDDSITEIEKLLAIDPEERMEVFRASITSYENKIEIEQKIIDNPLTTEQQRKNAVLRRNNARRQLGKKIDTGVVVPGEGDLRGVIEDDIDSMTSIALQHIDEFEDASNELRNLTNWRDVYLEPVEKRARAEVNVGRYEQAIEELNSGQRRLKTEITRARNAGKDVVRYTPVEWKSFSRTITDAEEMIERGEVPGLMVPVVQNEIRIARRREQAAQTLAREEGRSLDVAPRKVEWSSLQRSERRVAERGKRKGQKVGGLNEMSLAEAEAELARYPRYIEEHRAAQHKNQMQLETMNGTSQNRIAELEMLLNDAEAPLNDAGIKGLKARARQIDATARTRPGKTLAEKRLPEEQAELDQIAARIEQSTEPIDPERVSAMQAELAERQEFRSSYERDMAYDTELMGHVEDNGYRMLRELTQGMRAPTKAEARLLRSILGPEQGEEARVVLAALDDFLADRSMPPTERMQQAIEMVQNLASSRRIDDDRLDRILPPDEYGRALGFGEMTRAAQASAEVQTVLAGSGRAAQKSVDAEGFRENFFQLLIEQARARRQAAEQEIRHFTGWLDMSIHEDVVSTIGVVNKYFGGKMRDYSKKTKALLRSENKPVPTLRERRRAVIKDTIRDAMVAKGYDPSLSLTRRLNEAKTLRSRLNIAIRGLGLVLVESAGDDVDEVMKFWDNAALGEVGTFASLQDLTNTLRLPDSIGALARQRRSQLEREIRKAIKAGDTATADALSEELRVINEGRYLPTEQQIADARAAASPEPKRKRRRKAEPSEAAVSGAADPPNLEQLEALRTEMAGLEPRVLEADHQVESLSNERRALQASLDQAEAKAPAAGVTVESVISELEEFAASVRKNVPAGKVSHADYELAIVRNAAFADSLPEEMTPAQEAKLLADADAIPAMRDKLWAQEPVAVRKKAKAIGKNLPSGPAPTGAAVDPDAQAAIVEQITELSTKINTAQSQLNDLTGQRATLQQRIDELDKAHAQRSASDPTKETPSMLEDPIGAQQAEGLPAEGMSPETAPTHLIEDSIFDSDASPEDLLREYESVVAQSRALLGQYGNYQNMPPDVRRQAGELANRAEILAKRREEGFAAATQGFTEGDTTRLLAAAQQAGEAANPRIDMNWWTVISTGTPPSHVSTEVMRHPGRAGVNQRGVLRNQMRTAMKRGKLRGRGGSMYRGSLSARAEVLAGRHEPRVRVKVRNPKTGRMKLRALSERGLTRFERQARMVQPYNTAERDLRGIAERARAAAEPLAADIAAREASIADREAAFLQATGEFAEQAVQRRAEAMIDQQTKLNHANDAVSQAQRHAQRVEGQRERLNDAYTRALDAQNIQLATVRKRAIEVKINHEAAAEELALFHKAMRQPGKGKSQNINLRQIWGDVRDLLEFKRSADPIALYPPGTDLTSQAPWHRARVPGEPIDPMTFDLSAVPEVRQIEALLSAAIDMQDQIDQLDIHSGLIAKRLKDFDRAPKGQAFFTQEMAEEAIASGNTANFGKVFDPKTNEMREVFTRQVADGWQAVAEDMFTGPDALVIANSLQQAMDNIRRTIREPGFWKVIEKYTAFFSTYATARPGFHVRNAMSGTFMNMVDGVKIREMRRAPGVWRDFMRDPEAFWARTGPEAERMKQAMTAVFGSGAGGAFSERGLTEAVTTGSKMYRLAMNNFITKMNRKAGAYVEGPMRLAMAMDSINRGMSVDAALDRITKFHFDYTQLSEFDVTARRLIPFWTFMSRNLPLQIESMWLRPRTYLQYQSVVRNFGEEMNPLTPDYWLSQGAFTLDENAKEGEPWYLAPDLPHLRVAEPLTALSQGDLGRAVLSDINPLFLAPVEALAAGRKFYTGQQITDEPRAPQGAGEQMTAALLGLLGQSPTGASGQQLIDPRAAHITNSLFPPIELLNRLTSNEGTREGRQGETMARLFGAPVYKLTENMQRQQARNQRFDRIDERRRQAQLARL